MMNEAGNSYEGGCLCGEIRFQITGQHLFATQCCCRDCQRATGTGHTTIVGFRNDQLSVSGTPSTYTNVGESGGSVNRHFCGNCGGRIYTSGTLPGDVIMIQAGALDNPDIVRPENVIYYKDAVAWDHFDPSLEKFEQYAPFSEETLALMNGEGVLHGDDKG